MRRSRAALVRTAVLVAVVAGVAITVALSSRGGRESESTPTPPPAGPVARPASASFVWTTANGLPPVLRSGCPPRMVPPKPPAAFRGFPLPRGSVIVGTRPASTAQPLVFAVGYAPLPLLGAARYFRTELPRRGFRATGGDQEPWEAEATFRGNGRFGAWKVRRLVGCPRSVAFLVAIAPRTSAR